MNHPGWVLVLVGLVIAAAGLIWVLVPSVSWLGRLPGDIVVERENGRFYFPVTTCILVSVIVSLLASLLRRLMQ